MPFLSLFMLLIVTFISIPLYSLFIYTLVLAIKALKLYIEKNSHI